MEMERTVHAVTRDIDEWLTKMGEVRVYGEAFDVQRHHEGTFAFTLVGSRCVPVALDDLDGISAYTTRGTTIEPKARTRLETLDGAECRPAIDPRGVRVRGNLEWDPFTFRPQLRIEDLTCASDEPIRRELRTAFKMTWSVKSLPRWPLRALFLGRTTTNAYADLIASAPGCIGFKPLGAAMMGPDVIRDLCAQLMKVSPQLWDVVVIARGGGDEVTMLPFSDRRLIKAVEACPVPVLVAIGHKRDRPLIERAAARTARTPLDAGRVLRQLVDGARRDLEQLRTRCREQNTSALCTLSERQEHLATLTDRAREQAMRRRTWTWMLWMLCTSIVAAAGIAVTAQNHGWLVSIAVVLTVMSVALGIAMHKVRAERQRRAAVPVQDALAVERDDPVALEVLRRLRWSRPAIDATACKIEEAVAGLKPAHQTRPADKGEDAAEEGEDAEAQHRLVERLAGDSYSSDIKRAEEMERAIRVAEEMERALRFAEELHARTHRSRKGRGSASA